MAPVIDYFLAPSSPWTYLGHGRFAALAETAGRRINVQSVDFGVIFPQSGGLPLPKRAPQRQAYRLVELKRWSTHLGIPLILQPKYFPVDATAAACLIHGAPQEARMEIAGDLLSALWAEDRNIADAEVLAGIAQRHGIADAAKTIESGRPRYAAATAAALARGIFGAPTYVIDDELFWGQDRLDFVGRALARP